MVSEHLIELGRKMRAERIAKNMTQKCLAKKVGCTQQQISHCERGGNITISLFFSACFALKIKPQKIIAKKKTGG